MQVLNTSAVIQLERFSRQASAIGLVAQDLSQNRLKHNYGPSNWEGRGIDKQIVNARVIIIIGCIGGGLHNITIMRLLIIKGGTYRVCFALAP